MINSSEYSYSYPAILDNIAIFQLGGNDKYLHMSMIQNKKAGARQVIIDTTQHNRRIDNFMIKELGKVPKSRIYQMLRRGEIRVNGGRIKQDYRLQTGDKVRIPPVTLSVSAIKPQPGAHLQDLVRKTVIFENGDLLVLNKPAGLAVHGGSGQINGIIEILRHLRPVDTDLQLVHRLDRETSGCLMIAKNSYCLRWLHECLREGRIQKQYIALLMGNLHERTVEVTAPILKNTNKSGERKAAISESGKHALTEFSRGRQFKQANLTKVVINTGRTHQIRVHAAHIHHPVAGDMKYGDKSFNQDMRKLGLHRLFLHAKALGIPAWPDKQTALHLDAPLPDDLQKVLTALEIQNKN